MKTTIIIIAYSLLVIGSLTACALFIPEHKDEVKKEKFVGVDAAGFKHYPDGHIERININ